MTAMLLAFNGTTACGQFLGDTLVSIKAAWLMAASVHCDRHLLALSPKGELNFLWNKFVRHFGCQIVYDNFDSGNMDQRFNTWNKWFKERQIEGIPFDHYRELYRRIDGGHRQGKICGREVGLGKRNIFEYLYVGQESAQPTDGIVSFDDSLIDYKLCPPERDVLIAPYAKCQGNAVFTFQFWDKVVRLLVNEGLKVSVAHASPFCEDLKGEYYRRFFGSFETLRDECCRHRLVSCGNTGVGWMAAACGTPLLAMQPVDSHMQDYRYEWCGVQSLVEFVEEPNVEYVAGRIMEECSRRLVFTNGCFDIIHAGHVRMLAASKNLGTKLVVGLNSDESVRRIKGNDRPIHSHSERAEVLRGLRSVDEVVSFDDDTPERIVRRFRPDVLTKGADYKDKPIAGTEFIEARGGKVIVIDKSFDTSTTKIVSQKTVKMQEVLKAIRDVGHLTPNPFHKLKLMADLFLSVKDLSGDVADLGTYKGASASVLRKIAPDKALHCFDTWSGNPHSDPMCHHGKGEWTADFEECKRTVGLDKTYFHQGVFPETAKGLEDRKFCFVYVDADTYPSTKAAIAFFWPRLVKGGKMVFDDVPWAPCSGVEKAVRDSFTADQMKMFPEACACVVTK